MSLDTFAHLMAKLSSAVCDVRIIGGEPTLHPDLVTICRRLDGRGVDFSIATNGLSGTWGDLVGEVAGLGRFRGFLVSLHGAESSSHEQFTGLSGTFTEVCCSIREAVMAGIWVSTSTVLTRWSASEVSAIARLSVDLGARYAVFNRYLGPDLGARPSPEVLIRALEEVAELAGEGRAVRFGNCVPACSLSVAEAPVEMCPAGRISMAIGPTGDVRPCLHTKGSVGNLLDRSIDEVWQSPAFAAWRHEVPDVCSTCALRSACEGGCRVAESWEPGIDPLISPDGRRCASSSGIRLRMRDDRRPIFAGALRADGDKWIAYHRGQIVRLRDEERAVLRRCAGELTIRDVAESCGRAYVDMIAELWERGMIVWADACATGERTTAE